MREVGDIKDRRMELFWMAAGHTGGTPPLSPGPFSSSHGHAATNSSPLNVVLAGLADCFCCFVLLISCFYVTLNCLQGQIKSFWIELKSPPCPCMQVCVCVCVCVCESDTGGINSTSPSSPDRWRIPCSTSNPTEDRAHQRALESGTKCSKPKTGHYWSIMLHLKMWQWPEQMTGWKVACPPAALPTATGVTGEPPGLLMEGMGGWGVLAAGYRVGLCGYMKLNIGLRPSWRSKCTSPASLCDNSPQKRIEELHRHPGWKDGISETKHPRQGKVMSAVGYMKFMVLNCLLCLLLYRILERFRTAVIINVESLSHMLSTPLPQLITNNISWPNGKLQQNVDSSVNKRMWSFYRGSF